MDQGGERTGRQGSGSPAAAGTQAAPQSPCIRHCTLDDRDECVGCGRLMEEILAWAAAPNWRKIEISEAAAARREARRLRRLQAGMGGRPR